MVLPGIVKLILTGALAGVVGSLFGGLAAVARGLALALLLTLAIPALNAVSRRAEDDETDQPPLLLVPTLLCGLVAGGLAAVAARWLDVRLPYPLAAPHIAGWAQDLSAVLYGVLMLLGYRLRLRSRRWHQAMPYLVWGGAAIADGVRFLPLLFHAPSFVAPAFLGAIANVSVFALGWVLALRLHDPQYLPFDDEDDREHGLRVTVLAVRVAVFAGVLVCLAFLFARQVGFAHAWYTKIVWQHPELAEGLGGHLYLAPVTKGTKDRLDLERTNPSRTWPGLLERTSRSDAVLNGKVFIVGEQTAVRGWNLETGEMTIEFPMEWASIALSPDGQYLACVGNHAGDSVDALRVAIIQTADGTMIQELGLLFQRQGVCWTADGKHLVGVFGKGKDRELIVAPLAEEGAVVQNLGPGTRPHLDPATGEILYLNNNALWRRDLAADEPERVAGGMIGVADFHLTADPRRLLVTRQRFHRFAAVRHYILVVDLDAPARRHVLSSAHIPSWCLWTP
jgi:hypothetical protein